MCDYKSLLPRRCEDSKSNEVWRILLSWCSAFYTCSVCVSVRPSAYCLTLWLFPLSLSPASLSMPLPFALPVWDVTSELGTKTCNTNKWLRQKHKLRGKSKCTGWYLKVKSCSDKWITFQLLFMVLCYFTLGCEWASCPWWGCWACNNPEMYEPHFGPVSCLRAEG